jgi:phosphatidylethanolamine/phosphatidyl-N-methylethanolamine N-methyltransferase
LREPRQVGAVVSCSEALAGAMARALYDEQASFHTGPTPKVVELGPGTGRITEQLDTDDLTLVEIDATFSRLLQQRFNKATVLNMSAVDFLAKQTTPIAVISSIPLLNNPQSRAIKDAIAASYRAGIITTLVTYSYGPISPMAQCGFKQQQRVRRVLRNIPPANVWVYR